MFELSPVHRPAATWAGAPPFGATAPRWRVRLLGAVDAVDAAGPEAEYGEPGRAPTLSHWPTRAVAALLARLALWPDRVHPREELVELLWPGVGLSVGRNRLRQALPTLKTLLETPHGAASTAGACVGRVLVADRLGVRVVPGALSCDALDFERSLRAGDWTAAHALYRGDLMPGHYEEWVLQERHRLATLWERLDAAYPLFALPAVAAASRLALSA